MNCLRVSLSHLDNADELSSGTGDMLEVLNVIESPLIICCRCN